jgi:hypothetical protein
VSEFLRDTTALSVESFEMVEGETLELVIRRIEVLDDEVEAGLRSEILYPDQMDGHKVNVLSFSTAFSKDGR